ncbi:MAG: hypothetical protein IIY43_12455 [Oscillospiraceae bacterium]|nr:hypothetical protein [Oscillospiraceae bacterium]
MSTLHELIYYCSEEDAMGAVLLTGEWGCGKTYLVETTLAKVLHDTHMIVRVSLFGINSIDALNEAVRKQWLYVCTPFLGRLNQKREKLKKDSGFFTALGNALRSVNPVAGGVASAMVAVDPIDLIPISPEAEDLATGGKKRVVLIFDDLERSRLDVLEILGCINDYCENQGFNTIIIANEDFLYSAEKENSQTYRIMKEKVIAHTVLYEPEFAEIVHAVVAGRTWQSEPYTAFLLENEQRILEAFAGEPPAGAEGLTKSHNIRSLIFALKQFFRVYVHLDQNHIPYMEKYLYSFIVYSLVVKNGYFKDGKSCSDIQKEDLVRLYPDYSADYMPDSVRKWVAYGVWDRSVFEEEVLGKPAET